MSNGPVNEFAGPLEIDDVLIDVVDGNPNTTPSDQTYGPGSLVVDKTSRQLYVQIGTALAPFFLPISPAGVDGNNAFVFQPGGTASGQVYTTWQSLVDDYNAYQAAVADPAFVGVAAAQILFDDTYAAITIPTLTGAVDFDVAPGTTFGSARSAVAPIADDDRVVVTISNGVVWNLVADGNGDAIFNSVGLGWTRPAGAAAWLDVAAAPVPALAKFLLTQSTITNGAAVPLYTSSVADLPLHLEGEGMQIKATGAGRVFSLGLTDLTIRAISRSLIEANTIESTGLLTSVDSQVDVDSQLGLQQGLTLPNGDEINGPSASANVRPSPSITVFSADQLNLVGANNEPQILQALLFALAAIPTANDVLRITDGTTTEDFTFVAAAGVPFEVTIGADVLETLTNLATAITADSVPWKGSVISNPQTGNTGLAIIRKVQTVETYPDRIWTPVAFVTGAPTVGSFRNVSKATRLSYAQPSFSALPVGADPGFGVAGFATVASLLDGQLVTVIDGRSNGIYQAQRPLGAGNGSWNLIATPTDPVLSIVGAGTTAATRQTRFVRVNIGAVASILSLPDTFPVGVPLLASRIDGGAGTVDVTPVSGTIDGVASVLLPASSGAVYGFDGTNWHTVARS